MEAGEKAKQLIKKIKKDLFDKRCVTLTDEDIMLCVILTVDEVLVTPDPFNRDFWRKFKKEVEDY
jgi:hypothetical protein